MTTTATIQGRQYEIHLDGKQVQGDTITTTIYRLTGTRKADGALIVHEAGPYAGRALVVGISALERLNWWDITRAVQGLVPGV
jgi:hypothetical protein